MTDWVAVSGVVLSASSSSACSGTSLCLALTGSCHGNSRPGLCLWGQAARAALTEFKSARPLPHHEAKPGSQKGKNPVHRSSC